MGTLSPPIVTVAGYTVPEKAFGSLHYAWKHNKGLVMLESGTGLGMGNLDWGLNERIHISLTIERSFYFYRKLSL